MISNRRRRTFVVSLVVLSLSLMVAMPALAASYSVDVDVAKNCSSAYAFGHVDSSGGELVRVETEAVIGGIVSASGMGEGSNFGEAYALANTSDPGASGSGSGAPAAADASISDLGGPPTGSCYATVRIYVDGKLVYSKTACGGPSCPTKAEDIPSSLWLANVCEPYDNGAFDSYDQITFGTDDGNMLFVGSSYDGPWAEVASGATTWVLTKAQLEELATSQGVGGYGDLWFIVKGPNGYSEPRLLSSMIVDRIGMWGSDCEPMP